MTPREFDALVARWHDNHLRADHRAALIAMILANVNRDKKKKPQPFTLEDFMPQSTTSAQFTKKVQSPEQMLRTVEAINASVGGKDLRSCR